MGLRRSLLFVPGNNPAMVQQAGLLGADTVILDLRTRFRRVKKMPPECWCVKH